MKIDFHDKVVVVTGAAQSNGASMARGFADCGVRVNAIAPSFTVTPMTQATISDPAKLETLLVHVPMKRYAEPEELNGAALLLCSEHASYVKGVVLPVDGGILVC